MGNISFTNSLAYCKIIRSSVSPTPTSATFPVGTIWVDTVLDRAFICVDNTTNDATWSDVNISNLVDWQDSCLDKDRNSPPLHPSVGDRYLITSLSPSGDWAGLTDYIVEYDGESWDSYVSNPGSTTYIEDEQSIYIFSGSTWTKIGNIVDHGVLIGLADDDHIQYPLLLGRSGGQSIIGGIDASDTLTFKSTSNATRGIIHFGADDIGENLEIHDAGTLKFWDDSDDTSVTIGPVGDGTTILGITGSLNISGNIAGATYGSDGSISDAELLVLDDGATTELLVGGGAGSAPVWTTATGTGAPVRAGSPTFTGVPIAPTIGLSDLTDTYLPYHVSDASGLADSSLTYDGTKVINLKPFISQGTAAVAGSANLSTSGSSQTVTIPAADYAKLTVGTTLVANALTRYIIQLLGSNQVKVETTVNWSATFAYTYQLPVYLARDASGNGIQFIAPDTTSGYVSSAGAVHWWKNSAGNLGIGTGNPMNKFVVSDAGGQGFEFLPTDGADISTILGYNRVGSVFESLQTKFADYRFYIGDTEKIRIDTTGNIGIGTTSPVSKLDQAKFSADAVGSYHSFTKSRHATSGSHTIVQDNDVIGGLNFCPSDGTDFGTISAQIYAEVDDANPAASSIGGALVFKTAIGAGADDLTEAMRIDKNQSVTLGGGSATAQLILPLSNDVTTPTLAFGDGDSGFYESADDQINISIAGVGTWGIGAASIGSAANGGGVLRQAGTSLTTPFVYISNDTNTGVGGSQADQLSLIAGGVEGLRIVEDTTINIGIAGATFGTSADKVLAFPNGVAPSTSPADVAQVWSADVNAVAGDAGLHLRVEGGGVYKWGDSAFLPGADNDMSLGSATYRWANVYTADINLSNVGSGGNDVDGTEGSWRLQEGLNTMFLINNKTDKKYKILMEEI